MYKTEASRNKTRNNLQEKMELNKTTPSQLPITCPICRQFISSRYLKVHLERDHQEVPLVPLQMGKAHVRNLFSEDVKCGETTCIFVMNLSSEELSASTSHFSAGMSSFELSAEMTCFELSNMNLDDAAGIVDTKQLLIFLLATRIANSNEFVVWLASNVPTKHKCSFSVFMLMDFSIRHGYCGPILTLKNSLDEVMDSRCCLTLAGYQVYYISQNDILPLGVEVVIGT